MESFFLFVCFKYDGLVGWGFCWGFQCSHPTWCAQLAAQIIAIYLGDQTWLQPDDGHQLANDYY